MRGKSKYSILDRCTMPDEEETDQCIKYHVAKNNLVVADHVAEACSRTRDSFHQHSISAVADAHSVDACAAAMLLHVFDGLIAIFHLMMMIP